MTLLCRWRRANREQPPSGSLLPLRIRRGRFSSLPLTLRPPLSASPRQRTILAPNDRDYISAEFFLLSFRRQPALFVGFRERSPATSAGVIFTWSRQDIDPPRERERTRTRRRRIGFCALLSSLSPTSSVPAFARPCRLPCFHLLSSLLWTRGHAGGEIN